VKAENLLVRGEDGSWCHNDETVLRTIVPGISTSESKELVKCLSTSRRAVSERLREKHVSVAAEAAHGCSYLLQRPQFPNGNIPIKEMEL
jgi:hypothetical protein